MTEVYLALGSNVGDSRVLIDQAIKLLAVDVLSNLQQAPLYATKPVGYTDQPDFINTVVSGQTDLKPGELLTKVKQIEHQVGRIQRFRWGPREIDIDIILYGDMKLQTPDLTLPHLLFRERSFVLRPLNDLSPGLVDPVTSQTVAELLAALPPEEIPPKALTSKA